MTDHKQNPAEIYLVPMLGDDHDHIWCEDPAPGEGMREEDATRYVREDLVPASNQVLANSIAELTRKNSELQAQVSEQSKVIEHIAKAVGEETDPMACWEAVDALKAQVEQLRGGLNQAIELLVTALIEPQQITDKEICELRDIEQATPAQCLAEVKAQAVRDFIQWGIQKVDPEFAEFKDCAEHYISTELSQQAKAGSNG